MSYIATANSSIVVPSFNLERFFSSGVHAIYNVGDFRTLAFSVGDLIEVQNAALPGTRDLDLSSAPPEYVSAGLDGKPTMRFNGTNEYGISTGWTVSAGERPSFHTVMQATSLPRKTWFALVGGGGSGSLAHWSYLEDADNTWRQPTVTSSSYGAAVIGVPGLHQSGFPASGHYARLNYGAKSTGGTAGIAFAADTFFVARRQSTSNGLNFFPFDVSLFIVTIDSVDSEALNLANLLGTIYPTIGAALP